MARHTGETPEEWVQIPSLSFRINMFKGNKMKKMLGFIAAAFITTAANGQVRPNHTAPTVYNFYCDECLNEYARLRSLNYELNGPCCWDTLNVDCCRALGQGIANALQFYMACSENCIYRPWWINITAPNFTFEEFEYMLEMYQEQDVI